MTMIPVSIGVSPSPFILQLNEYLVSFAIHAMFVAFGSISIIHNWERARLTLILIQFYFAIMQVGLHTGFTSPMWLTGVISYILGFVAFAMQLQPESKWSMPWHRLDWYGWHDDFHVMLFVGDLMNAVLGARLLAD